MRMRWWERIRSCWRWKPPALHLLLGQRGERAARRFLRRQGLKFLLANFRSKHGEIDLIFRDKDCLVFVEVKTRSREDWTRPAMAVDVQKERRLSRVAFDYLRRLKHPAIRFRFDIVEVLVDEEGVRELRHIENAFTLSPPLRYG